MVLATISYFRLTFRTLIALSEVPRVCLDGTLQSLQIPSAILAPVVMFVIFHEPACEKPQRRRIRSNIARQPSEELPYVGRCFVGIVVVWILFESVLKGGRSLAGVIEEEAV